MLQLETKFNPFAGPEIEHVVYTTNAQAEIWTACYFGGENATKAYNESISLEFIGDLDKNAMEIALQMLVDRHEALRATFSTDGEYMTIYKQIKIELTYKDLSLLDADSCDTVLEQYNDTASHYLFDLVQGPLIKFGLLKVTNTKHLLVITAHHIICDGWSIGIILEELGIIYTAIAESKPLILEDPIPFSKFANDDLLFSNSNDQKDVDAFWKKMYQQPIPVVDIPTDNIRPIDRTYHGDRIDFRFDSVLLEKLKIIGLKVGASLVTTLLTCFEVFLYQMTSQEDLIIGLPSSGQAASGMKHLIGHCVNVLPLRSKINPESNFTDYLKVRKNKLYDAYDHQQLSFGHLLQQLKIARDPARVPLIPVVFNIDLGMTDSVHFSNLDYKLISNIRKFENFEIFLNASGSKNDLVFEWSYNTELFKRETISQMMVSFENLIKDLVTNSEKSIREIVLKNNLSFYEKLNNTRATYPYNTLTELLRNQANLHLNRLAIDYNDVETTYGDLQIKTNQLAHYLVDNGLEPGDVIAVTLQRSADMVATLLAILQCGAAFVPLDPNFPTQRLEFMLEDAEAKFLITNKTSSKSLSNTVNKLFLEDALLNLDKYPTSSLDVIVSPSNIAYILYTSGSTGKPKGVPINHQNLVNLLFAVAKEPGITKSDKQLAITTISFDSTFIEMFSPLLNGASLVMVDTETARDGVLLLELIKRKKITIIQATPTTWRMLVESNWNERLNIKACSGGESLSRELAQKILSKCDSLWNMYGPTETSIAASVKEIKKEDTIISIGKPIANYQFYIVNPEGQLLPPGVIGEIAIAGHGVANGYLKRDILTKEKFIYNSFSKSNDDQTLYLTGDLGKLLPSNEILCLGRLDHQVKIRGFRIELEEIEQTLENIGSIKTAIVLSHNNALIAYILQENYEAVDNTKIKEWKSYLASQLPEYFIPHSFNIVKELPIAPSGKLDRNALLKINNFNPISNAVITKPRTESEKLVASIWQEYLKLDQIDIMSNFFEIGGHSIIAVKIMIRIEKETTKRIPLSALFQNATIEKFAKLLHTDVEIDSDCLVAIKPKGNKVPLFIVHGAGLNVLNFMDLSNHFDEDQPVYGLQGTAKKYDDWYDSIEAMAAHYVESIIKINSEGPYAIAGFSFGGVVAFEMTRQLQEKGKKVILTALLDTYADSSYYFKSYSRKQLARFIDKNKRRLSFLKEMLLSWKAFKIRTNGKKKYLVDKYFGQTNIMPAEEVAALEQFIEANNMVSQIVDRYQMKPQDFALNLFRSKDDLSFKLDPKYLGWKKASLQNIIVHDISGDHLNIIAPPNDKHLARLLQDILDKNHSNLYHS